MSAQRNYAVFELPENHDYGKLFNYLIGNGYKNVMFLQQLHEHPAVGAYIEERDREKKDKEESVDPPARATAQVTLNDAPKEINAADLLPTDENNRDVVEVKPLSIMNRDVGINQQDIPRMVKPAPIYQHRAPMSIQNNHEMSIHEPFDNIDDIDIDQKPLVFDGRIVEPNDNSMKMNLNSEAHNDVARISARVKVPTAKVRAGLKHRESSKPGKSSNIHRTIKKAHQQMKSKESTTAGNQQEKCMICFRDMRVNTSNQVKYYNLVRHCKTHCEQYQFACPEVDCDYSCIEKQHITQHIIKVHEKEGKAVDKMSLTLKQDWLDSFGRCFPQLANIDMDKLIKYK